MAARFRFRSRWVVAAPQATLFAALADVDGYAAWWPQVRRVRRVGPDFGAAVIRSAPPVEPAPGRCRARSRTPEVALVRANLAHMMSGGVAGLRHHLGDAVR